MVPSGRTPERRSKRRFEMECELRYKLNGDGAHLIAGTGKTINLSSGGVAFEAEHQFRLGVFIELSISWPVLLSNDCPMRINIFGRVLRVNGRRAVCSIDKYEFRTTARTFQAASIPRGDGMPQRFADSVRKDQEKVAVARY